MVPQWIIEKKRDGFELTTQEIQEWVAGITNGSIPDYQITAWTMAVFFRGMSAREISDLTAAMMNSGDIVEFDNSVEFLADKHSTGGIGDKISIPLASIAAAIGLHVPMISGRGLGITGGTLDKLETISGFNTKLGIATFKKQTAEIGACLIGQTDRLAPADRRLYALRDVSGTVPSIPLITASIMSKKLAEGAKTLVFDVKFGNGAFMKNLDDATELAKNLIAVGKSLERNCVAMLTNMNEPLGKTVGNALEIKESIEILKGGGPDDVRNLTYNLTTQMAVTSGRFRDKTEALNAIEKAVESGEALTAFAKIIEVQGGNPEILKNPDLLPKAKYRVPIYATESGFVSFVAADEIGRIALQLGAGRISVEEEISPGAGIDNLVQHGDYVNAGDELMTLCSDLEPKIEALKEAAFAAVKISEKKSVKGLIHGIIE